jgi:hypothetical protein
LHPRDEIIEIINRIYQNGMTTTSGGKAINCKQRIMEVQPSKLHERSPLYIGSEFDVNILENFIDEEKTNGKTILE